MGLSLVYAGKIPHGYLWFTTSLRHIANPLPYDTRLISTAQPDIRW